MRLMLSKINRPFALGLVLAFLVASFSIFPVFAQQDFFSSEVEKAELLPINEINGAGVSYRGMTEEGLEHFIVADLPQTPGDMFYEAWLVKEPPEIGFVSLGVLESKDDLYFLRVLTEDSLLDYRGLVVTVESEIFGDDGVPETELLEGVFGSQAIN